MDDDDGSDVDKPDLRRNISIASSASSSSANSGAGALIDWIVSPFTQQTSASAPTPSSKETSAASVSAGKKTPTTSTAAAGGPKGRVSTSVATPVSSHSRPVTGNRKNALRTPTSESTAAAADVDDWSVEREVLIARIRELEAMMNK